MKLVVSYLVKCCGHLIEPEWSSLYSRASDRGHDSVLHFFILHHFTDLLTYLLTSRSRVLLEKRNGFQTVKEFPAFHGTHKFITAFPYPKPALSSPYLQIPLSEAPSYYCLPIYAWVYQVVSFAHVSPPKPCIRLSTPPSWYTPGPSHSSRFYHLDNIGGGVQIIKLLVIEFSPFPVTSSFLGPNILLNTLYSHTHSSLSSFNVNDQVSHTYKTTGNL